MWMFPTILNKKTNLLWKVQVHNPWCSFGAKKFLHSVKQIVIGRKTQQQCQFLPIFTFYQYIGKSDHLLALWIVLEKNPWRKWKFLDVSMDVGMSENLEGRVAMWEHNLPPPLVEIGLTDLPKSGEMDVRPPHCVFKWILRGNFKPTPSATI